MRKVRAAVAGVVLALSGIAIFTVLPRANAASATVNITDSGLSQESVTIEGGESVSWVNKTSNNVTLSSSQFSGQTFSGEFTNRFDHRGDYSYTVTPGDFHGVVHVASDAPTTAPPPTQPPATAPPSPNTTAKPGGVVRTTIAKAVPTTSNGGTLPLVTVPTIPTSTTPTTAGPPTTGGEFAIGKSGSSNRGAIIAIVAAGVAIAAAGGYLAYRRRLRSPF